MNKVVLVGRLARDPELKVTPSGTNVVSFAVACDRRYAREGEERQADFISCVAWNKTAEFINRYFTKGVRIALSGRIQTRSWEDDSGNRRYATEVIVEEVEFCQARSEQAVPSGATAETLNSAVLSAGGVERQPGKNIDYTLGNGQVVPKSAAPSADIDGFMPADDEDLPF